MTEHFYDFQISVKAWRAPLLASVPHEIPGNSLQAYRQKHNYEVAVYDTSTVLDPFQKLPADK